MLLIKYYNKYAGSHFSQQTDKFALQFLLLLLSAKQMHNATVNFTKGRDIYVRPKLLQIIRIFKVQVSIEKVKTLELFF